MKTAKLTTYFLLLIVVLAVAYFFTRPYFRLPFDKLTVYSAVERSAELLIKFPNNDILFDTASVYMWSEDAQSLSALLNAFSLDEEVKWEEWWLMPQHGENNHELTFTFIGSATELGKHWSPENYGPSLPFSDGQIYTYGIATTRPVYFTRYHNLIIVGRFPFQLERALLTAQQKMKSWADDKSFHTLLPAPNGDNNWQCIVRNSVVENSILQKIGPVSPIGKKIAAWDWIHLSIREADTLAYVNALLLGTSDLYPNTTATAWSFLPPELSSAYPVDVSESMVNKAEGGIKEWLGKGAWNIQLLQPASYIKVDPRMWVLPIGDSLTYRRFVNSARDSSDLSVIDRFNHQLFELEQWQDAGPFTFLTDRKLWQPWVCELPDALVISVYRDDLEQYLDYHLSGASIADTESFIKLREGLAPLEKTDWQAYQYWQTTASGSNIFQLLFPLALWSKQGILLAQASIQPNGITSVEAIIQEAPERNGTVIDWSVALPTMEDLHLIGVNNENHRTIAAVVQNTSGQSWAFDPAGRELWQNQFGEALLEPIQAVSYTSGVQRWIAATTKDIYTLDENGLDMANTSFKEVFPTAAPSCLVFPAIDRVMMAFPTQENKLVLSYLNGNSPNGWPVILESDVVEPILHISQKWEDLIIANTADKGWQIFNSLGKAMDAFVDTSEFNTVGKGYLGWSGNSTEPDRLVRGNSDGTLSIQHLSGESFQLRMGRGPVDNFVQTDCWGDDRPDYVVQRGKLLHLFAYQNNELVESWQYRLPIAPDRILAAPPLGVIAISDSQKKVWMIKGDGNLMDGFPLAGQGNALLIGSAEEGYRLITILDRKLYSYYLLDSKK